MSKRPVNIERAVDDTLVDRADLQSEYDRLVGSLRELAQPRATLGAEPAAADRTLEERRSHVHDQLHAIATTIAQMDAHDLSAMALKARVLLDWCEHERDDIVSQLTMSLCRDVLRAVKAGGTSQNLRRS